MKAQKEESSHGRDAYPLPVPNVYEIAVASAREAKRINQRLYEAGKQPNINVVRAAIKRVIGGSVAYKVEPEDQPDTGMTHGGMTDGEVDGHS